MRKSQARWWVTDPNGRYDAAIEAIKESLRAERERPFHEREYTPGHGLRCGCPGCSFMWAGHQAFLKFGAPPVIGTFEPVRGDYGRDYDGPTAQYRTWLGDRWHPYYEVVPKQHAEGAD